MRFVVVFFGRPTKSLDAPKSDDATRWVNKQQAGSGGLIICLLLFDSFGAPWISLVISCDALFKFNWSTPNPMMPRTLVCCFRVIYQDSKLAPR